MDQSPSQKQLDFARTLNIQVPTDITRAKLSRLIDATLAEQDEARTETQMAFIRANAPFLRRNVVVLWFDEHIIINSGCYRRDRGHVAISGYNYTSKRAFDAQVLLETDNHFKVQCSLVFDPPRGWVHERCIEFPKERTNPWGNRHYLYGKLREYLVEVMPKEATHETPYGVYYDNDVATEMIAQWEPKHGDEIRKDAKHARKKKEISRPARLPQEIDTATLIADRDGLVAKKEGWRKRHRELITLIEGLEEQLLKARGELQILEKDDEIATARLREIARFLK